MKARRKLLMLMTLKMKLRKSDIVHADRRQNRKQHKRAEVEQARRPRKKQRVEKEEEVTLQGERKRKAAELKSLDEYNSICKKMRPEFDPELECDNSSRNQGKGAAENSIKSKIIFFSVFSKSNKELNNQVMFKCRNQPKLKPKLNKKKKGSSQTSKGGRGVDIRTFLKPKNKPGEAKQETDRQTNLHPPSAAERLDLGPELNKSKTKLEQRGETTEESVLRPRTVVTPDRSTDREGESGVMTWDPALNSSSSNQLLSIHALPFVPLSQVNRLDCE